jgi:hypothetical protein
VNKSFDNSHWAGSTTANPKVKTIKDENNFDVGDIETLMILR